MKKTIFLLSIIFLTSCSKDNTTEIPQDQLPPITTTGANTAGCIINGKVIIPKNTINSTSGFPAYGLRIGAGVNFHPPIIGDDYFFVKIVDFKSNPSIVLWIQVNNLLAGVGTYNLGAATGNFFSYSPANPFILYEICTDINNCKVYYSELNSGTIVFSRFDYYGGIYSGTFKGLLTNQNNSADKVQITNGRFDIKIATLNN